MRYYLDTEFNGFGGALIALALVPEDADMPDFYAALDCADPTPWVAANVLPVLDAAPIAREALSLALQAYLADDPHPVLIADWPEDIAHAAMAMILSPGRRINIDPIGFELCNTLGFDAARESEIPHNALHDARALRRFVQSRN